METTEERLLFIPTIHTSTTDGIHFECSMNDEHKIISGSYDENIDWKTGQSNPVSVDQKNLIEALSEEKEKLQRGPISSQTQLALGLGYLSDPMQVDLDTAPDPRKEKEGHKDPIRKSQPLTSKGKFRHFINSLKRTQS